MHHHHRAQVTILRLLRVASGLRLKDVSDRAQIPEANLSRIETAESSISRAEIGRLARLYAVPESILLGQSPLFVSGIPPIVTT